MEACGRGSLRMNPAGIDGTQSAIKSNGVGIGGDQQRATPLGARPLDGGCKQGPPDTLAESAGLHEQVHEIDVVPQEGAGHHAQRLVAVVDGGEHTALGDGGGIDLQGAPGQPHELRVVAPVRLGAHAQGAERRRFTSRAGLMRGGAVKALHHRQVLVPPRILLDFARHLEAQSAIELGRLKVVRGEHDLPAAARPGLRLHGPHEASPMS